jgi:hypothetical protein
LAAGKGDGEGSRGDDDSTNYTPDEVKTYSRDTSVDGQLCQTYCSLEHAFALMMMMMMMMMIMVVVVVMMMMMAMVMLVPIVVTLVGIVADVNTLESQNA